MACGVCLGILLICLVQAEHVSCLRASQGESSRRQNGDGYVGFSQQESRLRRLESSVPQDGFRQASFSPRSSYSGTGLKQTAAGSGYSPGRSSQTVPRPAQTSRLFPKKSQQAAAASGGVKSPAAPKKKFQLSTAVVAGGSVSKTSRKNGLIGNVQKKPQTVRGKVLAAQLSSSSLSQRETYSFKPAQDLPAAGSNAYNRPKGGTPTPQRGTVPQKAPGKASASVSTRGRKVSLQYRPSGSSYASAVGYSWSKPNVQQPGKSSKPGQAFLLQSPSSRRSQSEGAQSRPASSSKGGTRRFAPTQTFGIPQRFGGATIRRLSSAGKPTPAVVQKPQRPPVASVQHGPVTPPPRRPPPKGKESRIQGDRKWMKARLL